MIKTILVILALVILASACTVDADECSEGYRAGKRQVKRMWRNRGSKCSNIDDFDDAVQRMIQNRYHPRNDGTWEVAHRCAERGANDMLTKYRQQCNSHIHCIRPRQSRVREEGHDEVCNDLTPNYVPYECEFGDKLCCTESSRTTVTFENKKHWGVCTKKASGDQETGDDEDEDEGDHVGNDDNNYDEETPTESEVTCDEYWLKLCCDDKCIEEETQYKSADEVREANVCRTECFDKLDGWQCNWRWRAEDCRRDGDEGSHIHCIRPSQSRVREEGHEEVCDDLTPNNVPYVCNNALKDTKLCCTESSMTTVTFKNKDWGQCTNKEAK